MGKLPAEMIAPVVVNVEWSDEKPQILSSLRFRALEFGQPNLRRQPPERETEAVQRFLSPPVCR